MVKSAGFHQDSIPLKDVEAGNVHYELPGRSQADKKLLSKDGGTSNDSSDNSRDKWGRKAEYVLSMIGYCVGLGNVWRFPYVCIRNGGGAFLIPFFICLTLCGLPLYLMEVAMAQFVGLGPFHVWSICPMFKGIGIAMNSASFFLSWYYSMILAWSLIYLVNSFRSPLPWTQCGQSWNTANCRTPHEMKTGLNGNTTLQELASNLTEYSLTSRNGTPSLDTLPQNVPDLMVSDSYNSTYSLENDTLLNSVASSVGNTSVSSSEEFWINNVLHLSSGLSEFGTIPWESGVALVVQAVIVYLCVIKGVSSVGKVVYVTATLPYILLTVLLIKGATLPGALDGVIFYLKPDFSKLVRVQTWVEASLQVFYSLGPAWGGLITMASYNKFNNNCLRDSVLLSFACEGSSVFAGFAIFTMLGHMAHTLRVPISTFANTGPGLVFVVYPEAISYLPLPQLWGVLFFIMLFTLGLDTQFVMCETLLTTLGDLFPGLMRKRQALIKLLYFAALLLISLPFATEGGMYLFQLVDWYFAAYAVIVNGILELVVVGWIYGAERFFDDIKLMLGRRPPRLFIIVWRFITPILLLVSHQISTS
ncbi:sodium- and chloride-dependent betaine transporter [Aplysia californica]|uniref:Transporter n=1 Tax=Aplysia californica TaxID=6500 RepID=A0ABM1VQT1_APLCA|nr:sodium- and chloride-dependent betaine transporter [Aplysia californica]